jgi:dihydroneopterin aldolase
MKIIIKQLTFNTIIGILPKERKYKQKVVVDLSFRYKFKDNNFINYIHIIKLIKKLMKKNRYKLIEDAIIDIKQNISAKYKVKKIKLTIYKPTILKNSLVAVSS